MPRRRRRSEEIIAELRQVDVPSDLFILRGVPEHDPEPTIELDHSRGRSVRFLKPEPSESEFSA